MPFFLLTDHHNMDRLLRDEVRSKFAEEGLEVQYPPEYEAARTVMLRNVDDSISAMSSDAIVVLIDPSLRVKKLIKIPNSSHLKIIFESADIADRVVREGLNLRFQRFEKGNIEKEMFVPVVPCYKCYSYTHQKRNCPKPQEYKICSICAIEGHYYTECPNKEQLKCINCVGDHRTLAAKCKIRKDVIRNKVREKRSRTKSVTRANAPQATSSMTVETSKLQLPENYLAVMAAAVTIAEKKETEMPGSFQYIFDEMLKANGIPEVKFPKSVIDFNKQRETTEDNERESRKRQRSSNGSQLPLVLPESREGRAKRGAGYFADGYFYPPSRSVTPTYLHLHQLQHPHLHRLRHPHPKQHLIQHQHLLHHLLLNVLLVRFQRKRKMKKNQDWF